MQDRSLKQRLMLIGAIILVGVLLITPPSKRLLPGLDIAGGTSLIFEIEEEPGENNPLLAEQMKELLQRRVDPQGVYDLVWRVVGRNRLEVQMPLPPAENARLKEEFQKALDDLSARNLKPSQISAIGAAPAESREAEMNKLLDDSAVKDYLSKTYSGDELNKHLTRLAEVQDQRRKDLQEAVAAADAREMALAAVRAALATQPAGSQPSDEAYQAIRTKLSDAEADVADANEALFKHNIDLTSLRDVLDMDEKAKPRKDGLAERRSTYAHLEPQIAAVVEKYDGWRAKRVLLEGSADLIRLLRGAGVLEFRILVEPPPADNVTKYDRYREQLAREGPRPQQNDTEQWFRIDNPLSFFTLNTLAELNKLDPKTFPYHVIDKKGSDWYVLSSRKPEDGLLATKGGGRPWKLVGAHASRDQRGRPSVNFQLDAVGGSQFRELTRRNIGRQLCIFVDDVAYSSANIQSEIGTSGEITGDFSADKIRYLIQTMQAGSLPGRLKDTPISERTIGSSLGEENLRQALFAGLVGLALVLVVMIGYYAVAGMVANVALLMNVLLVLAAMAMLGARFNLAGIAGVILGVGMAVDANVLIYERMREERERGSSLRMIIKNGYEKAFSTIFDSNVTTLLTCAILYYVGSEEIKGFGLTLGWGVVLNLFTAVFVTRVVFTVLTRYNLIKDLKMMKLIGVPNIDWYGKRRIFIP
ncbi:MAG: protein translocase subunit SecD, partial [Planctomycetes bacterium]|nr:protein translocase subunit SecD [Planctomycetota bacterium]